MSSAALRPSFWLDVSEAPDAAIARLEAGLARSDWAVEVQRAGRHMTVTVPAADRHFWSPWMNLEFGASLSPAAATESASVHVRFSPAPSIWTAFMMAYISLAALGCFALMYALAQAVMGASPTMLWAALACFAVWAGLWWVSWLGQRLARAQMAVLRDLLERVLKDESRRPEN